MKRLRTNERLDWQQTVENCGFVWHNIEGEKFWDEGLYYELTMAEVLALEKATNDLHQMCIQAVQHVIDNDLFSKFEIPEFMIAPIIKSWDNDMPISIYGRFDLGYNPVTKQIKMFEYNADTPTMLLESAIVQWEWVEQAFKGTDQFNSIHERLVEAWKRQLEVTRSPNKHLHLSSVEAWEDEYTITYMAECAKQAGWTTDTMYVADIGWHNSNKVFVDNQGNLIRNMFKLYPYEWMVEEEFAENLEIGITNWIEPFWKMILSNKMLLPLLWELNPGHPLLLQASVNESDFQGKPHVSKPLFSREGANITIVDADGSEVMKTEGAYDGTRIYQEAFKFEKLDGQYFVIGSWIIDGEAAGIGIRESESMVTNNFSRFAPHLIRG